MTAEVVDYRRIRHAHSSKPFIPNNDDDPPPRPGGVPLRLRSGHSRPDLSFWGLQLSRDESALAESALNFVAVRWSNQ